MAGVVPTGAAMGAATDPALPDGDRHDRLAADAGGGAGDRRTSSTRPPVDRDGDAWSIDGARDRVRDRHPARVLPARALGRAPGDGPAVRRCGARCGAPRVRAGARGRARRTPPPPRRRRGAPACSTSPSTSSSASGRSGWIARCTRRSPTPPTPTRRPRRAALARHLGRPIDEVLPTAGAAEAFTLVARAAVDASGRGAPAVHRAARRARAGRAHRRHRAVPSRLHPRPVGRPGGRRPGGDRQPDQPDGRPAPGVARSRPCSGRAGSSWSTRPSWTPSPARPSRSSANARRASS